MEISTHLLVNVLDLGCALRLTGQMGKRRKPAKKETGQYLELNKIYHCLPEPNGPPANIMKMGIILAAKSQ